MLNQSVVGEQHGVPISAPKYSLPDARAACRAWLMGLMRESHMVRPKSKPVYQNDALAKHDGIGGKPCIGAETLHFERIVEEFVRWRSVPEDDRSPAPAWWWGPAFEMRDMQTPMPDQWCINLGLAKGSTFADGARAFLTSLTDQTSLPWPDDFPSRPKDANAA